ncbi:unnamed protein product [Penicillium salamii]|nr:unnamed protein product [Penicillium salamii]
MSFWFSIYLSYYEIIERLLAEKDIDVNLIGGCGRFEMLSISLYHVVVRLDTVFLWWLVVVSEIDLNVCVVGYFLIFIAVFCGCVSVVVCLLNMGSVEINGRGFIDLLIC